VAVPTWADEIGQRERTHPCATWFRPETTLRTPPNERTGGEGYQSGNRQPQGRRLGHRCGIGTRGARCL